MRESQNDSRQADEEITPGDLIRGFRARVGDLFDVPSPPEP